MRSSACKKIIIDYIIILSCLVFPVHLKPENLPQFQTDFQQSLKLLKTNDFSGALAKLQLIYRQAKLSADHFFLFQVTLSLGQCHKELNRFESAIHWFEQAILHLQQAGLSKKEKLEKQSQCLDEIGSSYINLADFSTARAKIQAALEGYQTLRQPLQVAQLTLKMGQINKNQGFLDKALTDFYHALTFFEKAGRINEIVKTMNYITEIHIDLNQIDEAMAVCQKTLALTQKKIDDHYLADCYNLLGIVYKKQGNNQKAIDFYQQAASIYQTQGYLFGQAATLNNIGELYRENNQIKEASLVFGQALDIFRQIPNEFGMTACYLNLGQLSLQENDFRQAESMLLQSEKLAAENNFQSILPEIFRQLAELYSKLEKPATALQKFRHFMELKDQQTSEKIQKQFAEFQVRYHMQQKETELIQKKFQLHHQKIISIVLLGGVLAVILLILLLYNRYRLKVRSHQALNLAKEQIEAANLKMTQSIRYALKIQQAILPEESLIKEFAADSFLIYAPKDIVSGDFYWLSHINGCLMAAVIDCTGHGVPGAFMSMISHTLLKQIILEEQIEAPDRILEELDLRLRNILKQEHSLNTANDGLDIALIKIDKTQKQCLFSGARRPLYIINRHSAHPLKEIKGSRRSIGGTQQTRPQPFICHEFKLHSGDTLYLFSDGLTDQMNESFQKFGSNQLKNLLPDIRHHSLTEQKQKILSALTNHRQNQEQIDDITILAIKI
jgi:serine phosphatase RsbU (regulator of sigma subunit)/Tfp pilus assembly protein PilF